MEFSLKGWENVLFELGSEGVKIARVYQKEPARCELAMSQHNTLQRKGELATSHNAPLRRDYDSTVSINKAQERRNKGDACTAGKWTRNLRTQIRKCVYHARKEVEKRMMHFKSTFITGIIK